MRLLLDEHLAKSIATALRARGIDAIAVTEDASLVGLSDRELLRYAAAQRRVLVTYDVGDFRMTAHELVMLEEEHFGVVLLSTGRFPQGTRGIGALVDAIEQLSRDVPEDGALAGREVWL